MPIKANLNTNPYYDDFDEDKEFYRVLFRPGHAIQARELTTLQTYLQNQVEKFGMHIFEEGAMVIPGQISLDIEYNAVKLQATYTSNSVESYRTDYVGTVITGEGHAGVGVIGDSDYIAPITASGVKAKVIGSIPATSTEPLTLYVKYEASGTDTITKFFTSGEHLSASGIIGTYAAGTTTATLEISDAVPIGSSVSVSEGVYFTRGHFVKNQTETLILDKYTNTPSYRIGFDITESFETPEGDTSLLDNATGVSNFAAKGAHRLKINLKLAKRALDSVEDSDFIELMRVENGIILTKVQHTNYALIENTLARRTYDESGDYTIQDFNIEAREHLLDGDNLGIYDSGAGGDESKLAFGMAAGKAYVRGYEIETLSTQYIDIDKARDVDTVNNSVVPASLGNYIDVTNTWGTPDITSLTNSVPFNEIKFYDTPTTNTVPASVAGSQIGQARCRGFEHGSGILNSTQGGSATNTGIFRLYLFDVQMFTILNTALGATYSIGTKITGSDSGAFGYVIDPLDWANAPSPPTPGYLANLGGFYLTQVTGSFNIGETLTSSTIGTGGALNTQNATVFAVTSYDLSKTKEVFMDDPDAGQDFVADVVLDSLYQIQGTVLTSVGTTAVVGIGTFFNSELRVGDIIDIPNSTTGVLYSDTVATIVDDTHLTTLGVAAANTSGAQVIRKRVSMKEQEELVAIYKLPRSNIKTLLTDSNNNLTDSTCEVRRQFHGTSNTSGVISFTLSVGTEVFGAYSSRDYCLSILTKGTGTGDQGDIIALTGSTTTLSGAGTQTLTITDLGIFGNNAEVKLTSTVTRQVAGQKEKIAQKSTTKVILSESDPTAPNPSDIYGQRITDMDISLGVADAYAIRSIYLSKDAATTPSTPTLTLTSVSDVGFIAGSKIKGVTSGAVGGVISFTSGSGLLKYYVISGTFSSTEGITYTTLNGAATATVTATTEGDKNVTSDFTFDTGQRDSYYDISKIVRKASAVAPAGQVLVVFDYFTHSTGGDYFSVDSYPTDYSEIPQYVATRVDPDALSPSGSYELRDSLDFRSRVGDGDISTSTPSHSGLGSNHFIFRNRNFTNANSARFDVPKIDSLVRSDFEFYLNRIDDIYMTSIGEFAIQKGISGEDPTGPDEMADAMKLAEISIPAYTHKSSDVVIERIDNSRYTMRDIGKLEKRIANLEYYTSLNMLEADTQSLQIQDANGLDRFKSGFIVDNFSGHGIGDVLHPDYGCSMDMEAGMLRPASYQDNIELREWATTDTARSSLNYVKTGDLLMLPYSHAVMISQGFASRVENVNPFAIQTWIGVIKLTPSSDTWIDTRKAPDVTIDVEGNYESIKARERDRLGTVWNSWRTIWTGSRTTTGPVITEDNRRRRIDGRFNQWPFLRRVQRTVTTTDRKQVRTGINTRLVETRERRFVGKRVIDSSVIPWIRHKHVVFEATGFKPNTKVYPFFDGISISTYIPGGSLVTDAAGKLTGGRYFSIPRNKFRTGKRTFRLTDSSTNDMTAGVVDTSGEATYEASGVLNTEQSTFHSVRNALIRRTSVSDSRTVSSTTRATQIVKGWWDPLAQTFLVENKGGAFITKFDLFFQAKDTTLPVTAMIRTVENGNPAKEILPFSTVTLEPSDVNISDTGATATTFTFDSPVYLKHMEEYCLVVQTSSNDYKVWISQVGEKEIGSTRTISEQPYMGVLFKSQNSSTWTASQMEDLKFTMYKAKFDTSVQSTVKLINEEIATENETFSSHDMFTLDNNPISTESGVAKVRVYHENHGMHSVNSNVTISGVVAPTGEVGKLANIPLADINKDHTAISDIELDSYCVSTGTVANNSIAAGGSVVTATRDLPFNVIHPVISVMDFPDSTLTANIQTTSGQSIGGTEIAYSKTPEASAPSITLNEDFAFSNPRLVASKKNETANLNGENSLELNVQLSTSNENISPIVDTERISIITISNRIARVNSAADIGTAHTYVPSTDPEGDNNPAIYMTRKISLEVPATAIRTMLAASVQSSASIEVYYKILRTDVNTNFDDIGWVPYNTTGAANVVPSAANDENDFKDHLYTVDGLSEFIAFAIKVVMKGVSSSEAPLIKNFRAIALAL